MASNNGFTLNLYIIIMYKFSVKPVLFAIMYPVNNYSLKSRWIVAKYGEINIPKATIHRDWISIYTRSDLNKIREETIKKYDLIDRSGHLDTRQFKNRSFVDFSNLAIHKSLSLRKQRRNDFNATAKSLNCFLNWEEKKSFVVFCWFAKFIAEKVVVSFFAWSADKNGDSVPQGKTSFSCGILSRV